MSAATHLLLPLADKSLLAQLHAFDLVTLDGTLLVARDQAHRRLVSMLDAGESLPVDLEGRMIYYMGPSPAPDGFPIGSCGPTTSARMDPFAPALLDLGLAGMVGKGPRSASVVDAIIRNKAVYLQAYGGCGALYASKVKSARTVAFADLGPEAMLLLQVEAFPVLVAIDSQGNSVF
ncbi:MAG: FumA C-terminus/TtdB family hydratase beta subunit [Sphaerochaetaceae bacterium]